MGKRSVTDSIPLDKNYKVINVKPLRRLVPIFTSPPGMSSSSSPQTAPFVCAPPNGPFPPNLTSFYPFSNLQKNCKIPAPMPISSFKDINSGPSQSAQMLTGFTIHVANGGIKGSKKKGKIRKNPRASNPNSDADMDAAANNFLSFFDLTLLDLTKKSDGDEEIVRYVLMINNFLRRRLMQIEDSNEATPGASKRPDLKAGAFLLNKGVRTNMTKRVGPVPGVEIGDIFYFRFELCLVGMHAPPMGGIDYTSLKIDQTEEPLAVSIVSSGGYEDDNEDTDILIYSGQGGKDVSDQKLERGNLALEKSLHRGNEIRVIRGARDLTTISGKIYLYDGVYKIQESWIEKGPSGFNIFKYKLVRIPHQPQGFSLWKAINQWKENINSRPGLILPDLTSGGEILPVSLVNEIDDEKGPDYFNYCADLKYSNLINLPSLSCCSCKPTCDSNCTCVQRNGESFAYNALGVLMTYKSIIHECGSSCSCLTTCRNRVTQAGLKLHFEVFKTRDKGWGLRSLDPIRSGAFICEYSGEVIDKSTEEQFGRNSDDNFIFDSTRRYDPNEIMINDSDESSKLPFPLVISAKSIGNVARFMNHSCSPNVYWQPVVRERENESRIHIVFFAINNIAPLRELTFDYGVITSGDPAYRRKKCLCGSIKCRGYFY